VLSGMKVLSALSCLRTQEFRNVIYMLTLMNEFLRLKIGYLQASYALTDHKAPFSVECKAVRKQSICNKKYGFCNLGEVQ